MVVFGSENHPIPAETQGKQRVYAKGTSRMPPGNLFDLEDLEGLFHIRPSRWNSYENYYKDLIDYTLTNTIGDECIICLNNLEKNDNATLLKCGHVYHTQCIYAWFERKKTCPICDEILKI